MLGSFGLFFCVVYSVSGLTDGTAPNCTLTVTFQGLEIPDGGYVRATSGRLNQVYCNAYCTGPGASPALQFYKNDELISRLASKRIYSVLTTHDRNAIMNVQDMIESDEGVYSCKGVDKWTRLEEMLLFYSLLAPNEHTLCDNTKCIEKKKVCDGVVDCQDGKDESDCEPKDCGEDMFECDNGKCLSKTMLCDYYPDCIDGYDEEAETCPSVETTSTSATTTTTSTTTTMIPTTTKPEDCAFVCPDGYCMDPSEMCDGIKDCDNGADELNCPTPPECALDEFTCGTGECIEDGLVCDGYPNCVDMTDEFNCPVEPGDCGVDMFECDDGKCLPKTQLCDYYPDCLDGYDEAAETCGTTTTTSTTTTSTPTTTTPTFETTSTSATTTTTSTTTTMIPTTTTPEDCAFVCPDGYCMDPSEMCDGIKDCDNGADELNCPTPPVTTSATSGTTTTTSTTTTSTPTTTTPTAIDFGGYGAEHSVKTETNFFVTCRLNSSLPNGNLATYKWFKVDNTEVTSRDPGTRVYVADRSPGLELNIEPVKDEDAGRYKCVASGGSQTYERQLFLTVRATITFNECETEQFGVVGNRSEIKCSATGGEGTLSTEWRKEGITGTLVTNNDYALETNKLVVLQTTPISAGLYTFYASAGMEKKNQRITFRALTIPTIVQPLVSKTAVVGNTAELFCTARGIPNPRIDWFKVDENQNEVRMQTNDRITIEERNVDGDTQGMMKIKNVQKEDESLYACKAHNKATEITPNAVIPETQSNLDVQSCTSDEFRCNNGECIPKSKRCDANPDCQPGHEDELNCDNIVVCPEGTRNCNGKCMLQCGE